MGKVKGDSKQGDSKNKISSIAAHVPDLVVYSDFRRIPYVEHFNGVLLFADVSGFTALTERFSMCSKKGYGADELTRTLNSYIGDIVSHILAAGGDILNYAGDAILALWTVERSRISELISMVVKCGLNIQDNCGVRETDVGSVLRVKIGISAGKLSKVIMGNEENQYFVVIGRAVDEVRLAEGLAVAGNIILSPNAWELCDRANIAVDHFEDERAVKVRYIKRDPTFSVEKYMESVGNNVEHEDKIQGCVRKASRLMPNEEREKFLQKYIMKTVLQKIDANQPLEYLSEMRPVTIVFVNLQFKGTEADAEQCLAIHVAAIGLSKQMVKHHGRINKVFMFDKGCTFLCLFGLPGDKREDESTHALQAAYGACEFCQKEIRSLRTVSVGVTTGPVFCGVVGHKFRHEYTVIGKKVNLAARLMMHYPGMVSCDRETHHYSRLPQAYFTELPKKAMKGVRDPGPIYQFTTRKVRITVGQSPMSVERQKEYPLLGREKEMELYSRMVKSFLEGRASDTHTYNNVVIFGGGSGYGKSHLLAEVVYRASRGSLRVMPCELAKTDIHQQNYTLQTLLALLLTVETCKNFAEREKVILSQIEQPDMRENLCLLNEILLVKFPVSNRVSLMDNETREKETKDFIMQLFCHMAQAEPCVYVIDQAHFVDSPSCCFLLEMCEAAHMLLFLSVLLESECNPELLRLLRAPRTVYHKLTGLEPSVIAQLACQILGVVRIPTEVELFLVERSHGVPYYCEELLKSLYLSRMVYISEVEESEECRDVELLFPGPSVEVPIPSSRTSSEEEIRKKSMGLNTQENTSSLKCRKIAALDESASERLNLVCLTNEGAKFHQIPIPLTLRGMALAHLDQLLPNEQMVVKCAAIIGHTFTTQMLTHILPELTEDKLNDTLVSLFKAGTFVCGSQPDHLVDLSLVDEKYMLSCYCDQQAPARRVDEDEDEEDKEETPGQASEGGMWRCDVMRFRTALVKETAYDLWLQEQRRDFHGECAAYLLKRAHRCVHCPTDEFVFGHKAAVGAAIIEISGVLNVQVSCEKALLDIQKNPEHLGPRRGTIMIPPKSTLESGDVEKTLAVLDAIIQDHQQGAKLSRWCCCDQVLEVVLIPMACHWIGVGDVPKALYYLLESSAACIYLSYNFRALSYLNEIQTILDNVKSGRSAFDTAMKGRMRVCKFEKALAYRLKGQVLFNTGQIKEAEAMFTKALRLLGRRLPMTPVIAAVKLVYERMRKLRLRSQELERPDCREKRLAFLHEQINCLSFMWKISCIKRVPQIDRAMLAITMEQNTATLTSQQDRVVFSILDLHRFSQSCGQEEECKRYERQLFELLAQLPDTTEAYTLISHFIRNLCITRLCDGHLEEAIQYGYKARSVIHQLHQVGVDVWLMANLSTPMLFTNRYNMCVQVTMRLERLSNTRGVSTGKGWFYMSCLNCMLYAGFLVRHLDECLMFVHESQSDPCLLADQGLMFTLYSAVCLWYVRLGDWPQARLFYTKATKVYREAPSSLLAIGGNVMFLELRVLLFRKALLENNAHIQDIYHRALKCFAEFRQRFRGNQLYQPRLLHLQAYMNQLAGHRSTATQLLHRALLLCDAQGNKLERSWIQQSQAAWEAQFRQDQQKKFQASWLIATLTMPMWDELYPPSPDELLEHRYVLTVPRRRLTAKVSAVLQPFTVTEEEPHRDTRDSETHVQPAKGSDTSTRISDTRVKRENTSQTSTRDSKTRVQRANGSETSTRDSKTRVQRANGSETSTRDSKTRVQQANGSETSTRDSKTRVQQANGSETSRETPETQVQTLLTSVEDSETGLQRGITSATPTTNQTSRSPSV
ncbi:adenylate cyclase type 10-like isoform X3 [Alosa sapidissima]|uniref:adenylate cyclase type 10-like isoform X3 n=1 Tax=Alosa sapidissima TaxID=34773 RepID=UPI001C087B26|nr:adenylate cyclase type 10-like isoform X3 [Alosa sapidissima]